MKVELSGGTKFLTKLKSTFVLARNVVNIAPMLATLFIDARMHALQIDPKLYRPRRWPQVCFYGCIALVCVQTLLVVLMPFCAESECKEAHRRATSGALRSVCAS